jgi:hypothetical protein
MEDESADISRWYLKAMTTAIGHDDGQDGRGDG